MKRILFVFAVLLSVSKTKAQDLPPNAEPGKCYIKCNTPDVYSTETVKVRVKDASTKIVSSPAIYRTVKERVLAKAASTRIVTIPAVYKTVTDRILVKEASTKIISTSATFKTVKERVLDVEASTKVIPVAAIFKTESERVLVSPKKTKWVKSKTPGCLSENPNDCFTWCLKDVPAVYKTVYKKVVATPATTRVVAVPATYKTVSRKVVNKPAGSKTITIPAVYQNVKKRVVSKPASSRSIAVPAQYKTITKRVLFTPASSRTIDIAAQYKTITKKVLVKKGEFGVFKEVTCGVTKDKIAAYSISDIQSALKRKGYNIGEKGVNNEFNEATRKAFVKFQKDRRLQVGTFNNATLRALGIRLK